MSSPRTPFPPPPPDPEKEEGPWRYSPLYGFTYKRVPVSLLFSLVVVLALVAAAVILVRMR